MTKSINGVVIKPCIKDARMIRKSLQEELESINDYEKRAQKATNQKVKEVLLDIAKEEKVHFGELETLLKFVDPEFGESDEEGKDEVIEEE